jgi:hypothetical protein
MTTPSGDPLIGFGGHASLLAEIEANQAPSPIVQSTLQCLVRRQSRQRQRWAGFLQEDDERGDFRAVYRSGVFNGSIRSNASQLRNDNSTADSHHCACQLDSDIMGSGVPVIHEMLQVFETAQRARKQN